MVYGKKEKEGKWQREENGDRKGRMEEGKGRKESVQTQSRGEKKRGGESGSEMGSNRTWLRDLVTLFDRPRVYEWVGTFFLPKITEIKCLQLATI